MGGNLFFKLLLEDAKRRIWTIALSCYFFAMQLFFYVTGTVLPGAGERSLFIGPGNNAIYALSVLIAVICGLQGFSYLFSEKRTGFYFGLPLTRSQLFAASYWNGVLIFAVPCGICRLICCSIKAAAGSAGAWRYGLLGILVSLTGYLLIYHLALLSVALTGSLLAAAAGAGFLLLYGEALFGRLFSGYCRLFYHSFYRSALLEKLAVYFNPLALYGKLAGLADFQDIGEWELSGRLSYLWACLIWAAGAFALAFLLYRRRPAEAAGKVLAYDRSESCVRFALTVPLSLALGYCTASAAPAGVRGAGLLIGTAAGAVISHGLLNVLFHLRLKGMFAGRFQLFGSLAVCMAAAAAFILSGGRYDTRLPEEGSLVSAALSIQGLDDPMSGAALPAAGEDPMAEGRLRRMTLTGENLSQVCEWLSGVAAASGAAPREGIADVTVKFVRTDGWEEFRRYRLTDRKQLEAFDTVYRSEEYKEGIFPILSPYSTDGMKVTWTNGAESFLLDLTAEEREEFAGLCRNELTGLSLGEVAEAFPLGKITMQPERGGGGSSGYLYPSFGVALDWLGEKGIPVKKRLPDYPVCRIRISQYEETQDRTHGGTRRLLMWEGIYTEPEELRAILQELIPSTLFLNPLLRPVDDSYEAIVCYRDSDGATIKEVPCLLRDASVLESCKEGKVLHWND